MKKDNGWSVLGAVVMLLMMVGVIAFKLWLVYKRWEIINSPDVSFWEYLYYTSILK